MPSGASLFCGLALLSLSGCADVPVPIGQAQVHSEPLIRSSSGDGDAIALESPDASAPPLAGSVGRDEVMAPAARARLPFEGTWYLSMEGARYVVTLRVDNAGARSGWIQRESAQNAPAMIHDIAWDNRGTLRFWCEESTSRRWYHVTVDSGVLVGRVALANAEPASAAYTTHVTGWCREDIDRDLVPRVFDVRVSDGRHAKLRIDRDASGALVGRLKVYMLEGVGAWGEELEQELSSVTWDGRGIGFTLMQDERPWVFSGTVSGRSVEGTIVRSNGADGMTWTGTRAEVLSHGTSSGRSATSLRAWQSATRTRLRRLLMNGAPSPVQTTVRVVRDGVEPMVAPSDLHDGARTDGYSLSELEFEHVIDDPRGGPRIIRRAHAWLAQPRGPRPLQGWPSVIAFNGHGGSARQVMDPTSMYGYGDAYARSGYVVLAVDVSHRPPAHRRGLYAGYEMGDDVAAGNVARDAVASLGYDSDWEEDGERVWDGMRALDWLLADPSMNRAHVLATGLSMGGEVATLLGALDPRVGAVVSAGFSPDFAVMIYRGNHACWRWLYTDVLEYVDVSDYHAMLAPRALLVETGRADPTFSVRSTPWAADKEVMRRSRAAWADPRRVVHDLHAGAHRYHMGDPTLDASPERGLHLPVRVEPDAETSRPWQDDAETTLLPSTVLDLAGQFAAGRRP